MSRAAAFAVSREDRHGITIGLGLVDEPARRPA